MTPTTKKKKSTIINNLCLFILSVKRSAIKTRLIFKTDYLNNKCQKLSRHFRRENKKLA